MKFSEINHLAVVAAAVAGWLFGALWYGLLANAWVGALGKTMEDFKREKNAEVGKVSAIVPYLLSFVCELIMAAALFGILVHVGNFTVRSGMLSAAMLWFGFIVTTMAVNNAFAARKPSLTLIDAGHWLGVLLIMGAILGYLGR